MTFRKLLATIFLILTIIPLLGITFMFLIRMDKSTQNTLSELLSSLCQTQISNIQTFCNNRNDALSLMSTYQYVKNPVLASLNDEPQNPVDYEYMNELFVNRKDTLPYVESISVLDKEFRHVYSTTDYIYGTKNIFIKLIPDDNQLDFGLTKSYRRQTDAGSIQLIMSYVPIYADNSETELIGYLVEEIPVDYFSQLAKTLKLSADSLTFIVDSYSSVISGYANGIQYVDNEIEPEMKRYIVNLMTSIDTENYPQGNYSFKYNKENYFAYYSIVPNSNWTISISVKFSSFLEPTNTFKMLIIEIVASIILLEVCLIVFVTRLVSRPINAMTETLHNIRIQQDFSYRINLAKKDEVGVLGSEIDSLLEYVEDAYKKTKDEQKQLEAKATQDPLTKVKNQNSIMKTIEKVIESTNKSNKKIALGFIDIDNFRAFNTKYGHQGGDEVIVSIATHLKTFFGDFVGRNGGDEFLFVIEVDCMDSVLQPVANFMRNLQLGCLLPEGEKVVVSCSVGVVIAPPHIYSRKELIKAADTAMYAVKNQGKNNYNILEL